jgi:hypothetical protein
LTPVVDMVMHIAHLHECLSENENSVRYYRQAIACDPTDFVPKQVTIDDRTTY